MRNSLSTIVSLAAVAILATMALLLRPETVWSAPAGETNAPTRATHRARPTTRPSSGGSKVSKGGFRSFSRLTPEQEKEVLEYLKKRRPSVYRELMSLKEKNSPRYRRFVRSVYSFVARMRKLPEKVAKAHEVVQQSNLRLWRLAREYGKADTPAKKKELEAAIKEQATKQFQAEQIVRRHRLSELEEQIRRLRAELDQRAKDSDSVIQETVDQIKRNAVRYHKAKDRSADGENGRRGKKGDKKPSRPDKTDKAD